MVPRQRLVGHSLILFATVLFHGGCSKPHNHEHDQTSAENHAGHRHVAPHGGTAVVLGDEEFHLEVVIDPATGRISAWVLDAELESFVRIPASSIEIFATADGRRQSLVLSAVPNPATGETVGDTSLFETDASWLKTWREFEAVLPAIMIRGKTFSDVRFDFPAGNEHH